MLLIKQAIIIITIAYLLILIFVYFRQESMIFFPTQVQHAPSATTGTMVYTHSREDVILQGWLVNGSAAANRLLLYYGGNAEDIFYSITDLGGFAGTAALLVNYRGYGQSSGKPGEKELFADALAVYDDIVDKYHPQKIVVMGRSLGSAVAVYVAARRKVAGVILVTPFDSIESLARQHYPFLPVSLLLRHPFRSIDVVEHITAPSLIIHGGRDTIIPHKNTERLLSRFTAPTETLFIEEGGHNDIETFPQYRTALQSFLDNH